MFPAPSAPTLASASTSTRQPWSTPNLVNPQSRGPALLVLSVVFPIITVVVTLLRLYARLFIIRALGLEDALIALTLVFIPAISAALIEGQYHGWRQHIWDQRIEWERGSKMVCITVMFFSSIPSPFVRLLTAQASWFSQLLFVLIMTTVQLSILASYRRLAIITWFRRCVWALVVFTLTWGLSFAFVLWFSCQPLRRYWDAPDSHSCRVNDDAAIEAASVSNIVAGFVILSLPMPILWKLRLSIRERLYVTVLMSVGLV